MEERVSEYVSLLELMQDLKAGITDLFPDSVWVKAEVSQIQARANGHCYLDLVQSSDGVQLAKARACIWRATWAVLSRKYRDATGSDLSQGHQILVNAQVNYSELYGLSLIIEDISPEYTIGEAELKRQETIKRLQESGKLEKQQRLVVPQLPYRLAVISAADAAGYGDFVRHLTGNEYGFVFQVDLFAAAMQGTGAPDSIAEALAAAQVACPEYDAVLIIRGGGSNLDLACFDDHSLCCAISDSRIPVYTAIGHDKDFHVADMVARAFVKTPTALADLFIDAYASEDERISSYAGRLKMAFASKISRMESVIDTMEQRIRNADPRAVLSRGYSLVTDSRGVVVKSSAALCSGDTIRILFKDGQIEATVR